jgi:hypothetical protein
MDSVSFFVFPSSDHYADPLGVLVFLGSRVTTFADAQFYFPDGPPASREMASQCLARIDQIFSGHPDGLPASGLFTV